MQDYLGSLTSLDVEMTEEALQKLVDEQFGEDYSDSPDGGSEQE